MIHPREDPLDPVARLHVLAAALPGSVVAERTLAATFDRVWRVVTDLETMTPRYESNVHAVEIVDRKGESARAMVTLRGGHVEATDVRIVPGWCLMQSESTIVAFAARATGHETVLAHLEHSRRSQLPPNARPPADAYEKLAREVDTIGVLATGLEAPN